VVLGGGVDARPHPPSSPARNVGRLASNGNARPAEVVAHVHETQHDPDRCSPQWGVVVELIELIQPSKERFGIGVALR
jgi:hypothetical protein